VAVGSAEEKRLFVGPDNGLLLPALERFGGAAEVVEISTSPVRLDPVSPTFAGRDVFAPVAAHLALGEPLADLGEALDPRSLVEIERRDPVTDPGLRLEAEVGHVDAFGNLSLIATAADADDAGLEPGGRLRVRGPRRSDEAVYALTFADAEPGQMVLLVDSARSLALAVNRGDASRTLDLAPGDRVLLTRM
jgi:S-adenosylmethionine hydrolase